MEKPKIKLQDGDVLSIKKEERLVMGHETFKFEHFWRTLKQRLQIYADNPKSQWLIDGVECDLLSPRKEWQKGKIRLVLEFIPDQPEPSTDQSLSNGALDHSLDDIRQQLATEN